MNTFKIKNHDGSIHEVEAEPVELKGYEEFSFVAHANSLPCTMLANKENPEHIVISELTSGGRVGIAPDKDAAILIAIENMNIRGGKKWLTRVLDKLSDTPGYPLNAIKQAAEQV